MSNGSQQCPGYVIPTMRYRDAAAALDWLCKAFGFRERLVVLGENGGILHAQLTIGESGMIMLGSLGEGDYDKLMRLPSNVGGTTQAAYIVIKDIDAHYERAKAAGAEIVIEIADQGHGGRLYSCRDPEGQIWNFGSYDPWKS